MAAPVPSLEPLSIAQILADLMSLQNTDHHAATSLLLANKSPSPSSTTTATIPSLRKSSSSLSSSLSLPEPPPDADADLQRARELVRLYSLRGKFKQMGDTGLGRAKERVDDVVRQTRGERREGGLWKRGV